MNNKPIIAQVILVPDSTLSLCHNVEEVQGIFEPITVATLENEAALTVGAPSVGRYKLLPLALAEGVRAAKAKESGFFTELAELMERYNACFDVETSYDTDGEGEETEIVGSATFSIRMPDGYNAELANLDFSDGLSIWPDDFKNNDMHHYRWEKQREADLKKEANNEPK